MFSLARWLCLFLQFVVSLENCILTNRRGKNVKSHSGDFSAFR